MADPDEGGNKMIKYICDKCGAEMDETTRFHIEVELPMIRRWDLEFLERGYDLCEKCIRKVDAVVQKH